MSKIAPCLWFNDDGPAAARFYAATFHPERPAPAIADGALVVEVDLSGVRFQALSAGPVFRPNPSISFFVHVARDAEVQRIVAAFLEGGQALMPLGSYPWSPCYAWVQDRFGVSWQVLVGGAPLSTTTPSVAPSLLFSGAVQGRARAAIDHYVGVFGGDVARVEVYGDDDHVDAKARGLVKHARFRLAGQEFVVGDSPIEHAFAFSEGVSLSVRCADQAEVDRVWDALKDGGSESRCGWLKDRFGVSWQVVPDALVQLQRRGDAAANARMMQAMMTMAKLDVAALQRAHAGG